MKYTDKLDQINGYSRFPNNKFDFDGLSWEIEILKFAFLHVHIFCFILKLMIADKYDVLFLPFLP